MTTIDDLLVASLDDVGSAEHNGVVRWSNIVCTSTTRPAAAEGMEAFETDTGFSALDEYGQKIRYEHARWIYTKWDAHSPIGDARWGTKPADIRTFPCIYIKLTVSFNMPGTGGTGAFSIGYGFDFPNCILDTHATVDSDASALFTVVTADSQTHSGFFGTAYSIDPATGLSAPTADGLPVRMVVEALGC